MTCSMWDLFGKKRDFLLNFQFTCKSEKVVSYHVDLLSTVICDAVTYILCMFVTPGLEKSSALDYEA